MKDELEFEEVRSRDNIRKKFSDNLVHMMCTTYL